MVRTLAKPLLAIPSLFYGAVVCARNLLYDRQLLKSATFCVPIICVGNITVGGTGKTPHVEFLIRAFADKKVAVLSRGYRRKSRGFVLATPQTTAAEIGDEPFQIFQKFSDKVTVAVCEKRAVGIEQLLEIDPTIELILLDDAFQHRQVKAYKNIVLVDSNRPIDTDFLLPLGRLREPRCGLQRADCVIVTKCCADETPNFATWQKRLKLNRNQQLFFTTFDYETPNPLFADANVAMISEGHLLVVTGIVSPEGLHQHLAKKYRIETLQFGDHHDFSANDLLLIERKFSELPSPKAIVVTEKDAARLCCQNLSQVLRTNLYSIGIRARFLGEDFPTKSFLRP